MKFGKYLAGRQLELPEYNGYFIDYKALKKLIKQLSVPAASVPGGSELPDALMLDTEDRSESYQRLQENKASFFFRLERELEKVNDYYLEKEAGLKVVVDIIQSRYRDYLKRGKLISKKTSSYRHIRDAVKKVERDLTHLEHYVELNRTGFSKVLKKWDKRSHSHTRDFYLATVVSVQPVFTHNKISKWNDAVLTMLFELDEISNEDSVYYQEPVQNKNAYAVDMDSSAKLSGVQSISEWNPAEAVPSSVNGLFDIELEIEGWYMEALHISKLTDPQRKLDLLGSFAQSKVQAFVDERLPQGTIDKQKVVKDCLTNIFLPLVSSDIDDISLKHFLINAVDMIDLTYCDEEDLVFSRRNVFHEAACCTSDSRVFVLEEALNQCNQFKIDQATMCRLLNARDTHGRTPLHYACDLGKTDFVRLLIKSSLLDTVNIPDTDSKTPLVLAIIKAHAEITRLLLVDAQVNPDPQIDESGKPQFSPLSVACANKNLTAARMILEIGNINLNDVCDSQGLQPLHIVAKNGGDVELIELLVSHGANPNAVDGFNKWTPIFYAVQEGYGSTVQNLLSNGAKLDVVDGDNLSPLFYALWEGHLSVLNILLNCAASRNQQLMINRSPQLLPSNIIAEDQISAIDSLSDIPDFELPPPIIPLRKYGHNFLERKIFVKLLFSPGRDSIMLNKEDEMVLSSPGRITLTPNVSNVIPRNIPLPIQDDEEHVAFQVGNLDNLSIDFELFPSFGTRLIAKTNAMSSVFREVSKQCTNDRRIKLPLFDSRLKNVGELELAFEVIFPYSGKPLEITKYDTYWKSTTGSESGPNGNHLVTSSSLAGKYTTVLVTVLSDGKVISAPDKVVSVSNGAKLLLSDITSRQLELICGQSLDDCPKIETTEQLNTILNERHISLDRLLSCTSPDIQLDLEVFFPTALEINTIPVKVSPTVNINQFIDDVLLTTFNHVRYLNHNRLQPRSIVFTSCNPRVCSILNWKQPNYPVIYQMNGLRKQNGQFTKATPHHLEYLAQNPDSVSFADPCSRCIREAVNFSCNNNLLGIVIPLDLLSIYSQLEQHIRNRGLLLIGSHNPAARFQAVVPAGLEINAVKTATELQFQGAINM